MEIKKVLVTGSEGYIGSVLVSKLIKRGYDVTGIDVDFFKESSVFKNNVKIHVKNIDIRKVTEDDISGFDAIIHLSALSNDPLGEINPGLTREINYKASVRLAKIAKKSGVKKFIFSSSCSIYGIAKSGVVDEKSKVNPQTSYAKSKIETEKELAKLADNSFFVGLMRNSTVYGFSPKFRNDLVVNNLVSSGLSFGEIRILSDGTPWRPLIDVRDLSDIFIAFLQTKKRNLNGKVINIGFKENNYQVKELAEIVKKNLPQCKIIITGEHGSDSRSYKVDFRLFRKMFPDVKQKWTVNRSVKDMIKIFQEIRSANKDFQSGKYSRIGVLKKLLSKKLVNTELYRIHS